MTSFNLVLKSEVEAMQIVTTMKVTDPRQTRRVLVAEAIDSGMFRRCLRMVLYYMKEKEEDGSGWMVAGWMRESLGKALMEQPLLGGRLQNKDGRLDIVSNDGGVRLLEARIPMHLPEFMELQEREEAESELLFWDDIDEHNPQFYPLCYIQVTNFLCGGYSIGISCSILLADLLLGTDFLKTWANIHQNIVIQNGSSKLPLFYSPNLKRQYFSTPSASSMITSTSSNSRAHTIIFKVAAAGVNLDGKFWKKLALQCLEEVENKHGSEATADYSLFVNESFEAVKVESLSRLEMVNSEKWQLKGQLAPATWDLGENELSFTEGNKPVHVSKGIGVSSDGVILAFPSLDANEVNIIVTIPHEK